MPKCIKLKRKHRQVCIGDRNEQIDLQTRASNNEFSAKESFTFTTVLTPWAMVETLKNEFILDEVTGGDVQATHAFTIIVPSIAISGEFWVLFKSKRYRVLDQVDFEERGEYLKLMCTVRGSVTKAAADA